MQTPNYPFYYHSSTLLAKIHLISTYLFESIEPQYLWLSE